MKDKGLRGFIGALKCLVGLHEWTWRFERGSTLILDAPPPDNARCARCGKVYGRNVKQCGNVVYGDMAGGDIVKSSKPNAPHQAQAIASRSEYGCSTIGGTP